MSLSTPSQVPDHEALTTGDSHDIARALQLLGASESVIAQAVTSFIVPIPGAMVSRVEGGFQFGKSRLPVWSSQVPDAVGSVHSRITQAMASNDEHFRAAA